MTPPLSPPRPTVPSGIKLIFFFLPFVIGAIGLSQFWWPNYQRSQLLKTGVQAPAYVTNIESTGTLYNNQPQVILTIRVQPRQGTPFTAKTKMVISQINIPQFQPGALVNVYYDPDDRTKVAIE